MSNCDCVSSMIDAMTNTVHLPHPAQAHRRNVLGYLTPARSALLCASDKVELADDSSGFLDALGHLTLVQQRLTTATDQLVRAALDHGCTWAEVGRQMGTSRQAAQQRFGHLVPPAPRQS